ncbi:MAG: hypothetical protein HY066_09285 [Betaproteobacteria bacterium]|nr:hypothetical protein [Betaproteobacteria bacterium]
MKTKQILLLLMAFFFASTAFAAVDLFLVIGQSNARGRGSDSYTTVLPPSSTALEFNSYADLPPYFPALGYQTGIPINPPPQSLNYWTSDTYGFVPAFATQWYALTGRTSVYVIRPKGGTGLTSLGNVNGSGYWTDYSNTDPQLGIYRKARQDFSVALNLAKGIWGTVNPYVIWHQGENDAYAGVSASIYQQKLEELYGQLQTDTNYAFKGMFISEIGYYFNSQLYLPTDSTVVHRGKIDQIVTGQQNAAAQGNIVLVSKSPRVFMSACINGFGAPGCESQPDLGHYKTLAYEALGKEMATNAYIYVTTGIKPLLPSSCSLNPFLCGATVDVYRWFVDGVHHISGLSKVEFDPPLGFTGTHPFKGIRFQLFQDPATGRIPFYRVKNVTTGDRMDTTNPNEGSPNYSFDMTLGYCYLQASSNADRALSRLTKGIDHVTTKQQYSKTITESAEYAALISQGYTPDGVLCYVN